MDYRIENTYSCFAESLRESDGVSKVGGVRAGFLDASSCSLDERFVLAQANVVGGRTVTIRQGGVGVARQRAV